MRIWWVFSFINCFLLSISAIVCYGFVDWYVAHIIKEFEGELMCGIGLHAWNMRSHFGLIIHWLYNYCCICIYMYHMCACILKAWQMTREYLHLTFSLEWLQVLLAKTDSQSILWTQNGLRVLWAWVGRHLMSTGWTYLQSFYSQPWSAGWWPVHLMHSQPSRVLPYQILRPRYLNR